jgi:transposase, IS5 family
MRKKRDTQGWLEFQPSTLALTQEYFARYEGISAILDETPKLLELVHLDLELALELENREAKRRGGFVYTSEMVLRLSLAQVIEGASLREIVVRVDDSHYLRRFTRFHSGPMMNHATLCKLRNAIQPETWKKLNGVLAKTSVAGKRITGEKLRLDTTAVETNIHWPTDSSLLWDGYRTLGRLIEHARRLDPRAVGNQRVHLKRVKRLATMVARRTSGKGLKPTDLGPLYKGLIPRVARLCDWVAQIVATLERGLRAERYGEFVWGSVEHLVEQLRHFEALTRRVIWQASERVLFDRPVPNDQKLFSLFEDHTELLKRGKAGKDVEFGHMVQLQQVGGKFITDYEVFAKKPIEPALVHPALRSHKALFGCPPENVAADKGYWSSEELDGILDTVAVVAIPKKGGRDAKELKRELDPRFKLAQRFRAGIEGSISFLKRLLRLARCMNKGWKHYVATVGATVLAHNLLVLARC